MQTAVILSFKMFSRKILKSSLIVACCFCFFTTFQSMYNSKFIINKPFRKSKSIPTPPQRKIVDGSEEKKNVSTQRKSVLSDLASNTLLSRENRTHIIQV